MADRSAYRLGSRSDSLWFAGWMSRECRDQRWHRVDKEGTADKGDMGDRVDMLKNRTSPAEGGRPVGEDRAPEEDRMQ